MMGPQLWKRFRSEYVIFAEGSWLLESLSDIDRCIFFIIMNNLFNPHTFETWKNRVEMKLRCNAFFRREIRNLRYFLFFRNVNDFEQWDWRLQWGGWVGIASIFPFWSNWTIKMFEKVGSVSVLWYLEKGSTFACIIRNVQTD